MEESEYNEISRRISAYPAEAHQYIQSGFAAASKLSEKDYEVVLDRLTINLRRGKRTVSGSDLGPIVGLNQRDSDRLASTFSIMIGLFSDSTTSPQQFLGAARGVLFLDKDGDAAAKIAALICSKRAELDNIISRAQLGGTVLPSLSTFEVEVDLRLRITNGIVKASVPVAILHIDTDASNQELWFQMSIGDVEDTLKKLTAALEDLKTAEFASVETL